MCQVFVSFSPEKPNFTDFNLDMQWSVPCNAKLQEEI